VDLGKIRYYGISTWNGLRASQGAGSLLPLERFVAIARQVGGVHHHFRAIQLPYSLAMPEAFTRKNQTAKGAPLTPLEAAAAMGLYVVGSAPLFQSRLAHGLPPEIRNRLPELETDAQRAIQFARSTPGIGTVLIGMKEVSHVEENLKTLNVPVPPPAEFRRWLPE